MFKINPFKDLFTGSNDHHYEERYSESTGASIIKATRNLLLAHEDTKVLCENEWLLAKSFFFTKPGVLYSQPESTGIPWVVPYKGVLAYLGFWAINLLCIFGLKDYKFPIRVYGVIQALLSVLDEKIAKNKASKNKWISDLFVSLTKDSWDDFNNLIKSCNINSLGTNEKNEIAQITNEEFQKTPPKNIYFIFNEKYYTKKFLSCFFNYENPAWKNLSEARTSGLFGKHNFVGMIPCANNVTCCLLSDLEYLTENNDYAALGYLFELLFTIYYQIKVRNTLAKEKPELYTISTVNPELFDMMSKIMSGVCKFDPEKNPYSDDGKKLYAFMHKITINISEILQRTCRVVFGPSPSGNYPWLFNMDNKYLNISGTSFLRSISANLIAAEKAAAHNAVVYARETADKFYNNYFAALENIRTAEEDEIKTEERAGKSFDQIIEGIETCTSIEDANIYLDGSHYILNFTTKQPLKVNEEDEWKRIHRSHLVEYTDTTRPTSKYSSMLNEFWYNAIMEKVFCDHTMSVNVRAFLRLDLTSGRICRSTSDVRDFSTSDKHKYFSDALPHPHIMAYNCFGTYSQPIMNAARERDYLEEIILGSISAGGLNYADSAVCGQWYDMVTNTFAGVKAFKNNETGEIMSFNDFKAKYIKKEKEFLAAEEAARKAAEEAARKAAEEAKKAEEAAKKAEEAKKAPKKKKPTAETTAEATAEATTEATAEPTAEATAEATTEATPTPAPDAEPAMTPEATTDATLMAT